MKYKIPFNKKLYIEQTRLILPYIFSSARKKIRESLMIASFLFLVGILILIGGSDLSTLFFAVGIFVIFNLYMQSETYTELKNSYIRSLRDFLDRNEVTTSGIFDFREDCLRLSNDYLCTWIYWEDFYKYKIVKSNLLLFPKEISQKILVIGKSEVGKKDFQNILDFVKEKIS